MDIEWALADGQFVLLQSRYITTSATSITPRRSELCSPPSEADEAAVERIRQAEIQILETRAEEPGYRLVSSQPCGGITGLPLPMTWEVMKELCRVSAG